MSCASWEIVKKKWVYYNEIDAKAAAWTRELMKKGLITEGEVDERSIEDVLPADVAGFDRCHFFSGIAGWDYALNQAGYQQWDRIVWTGSCPCQSFSQAGQRKGFTDERHLWSAWFWLIQQCRPDVIFGEQVAGKDGRAWLDLVQSDLEAESYAVGAVGLCAAGFGAPHIRERFFFVADTDSQRCRGIRDMQGLGTGFSDSGELGDTDGKGLQGRGLSETNPGRDGSNKQRVGTPGFVNGFWKDAEWIYCRDGKYRPTKSSIFPLASGVPARVGRLRGYGNAINTQVAIEFIRAYMEWGNHAQRSSL